MGFPMATAVIRRLQRGANPRQGSAEARAAINGHHGGPRYWRAFHCAPALRLAVRGNRANHREHDRDHRGGDEVEIGESAICSGQLDANNDETVTPSCPMCPNTVAQGGDTVYESPSRLRVFSLLALLASVGCDSPMLGPAPVKLNALTLRPSPLMVTAVVATVDCSGAALAFQVAYRASGDSGATPRTAASGCP